MSDRDWLMPSIVLTVLAGTIAFLLIPDISGIMPAVGMLPYWMLAAGAIGCFYGYGMMIANRVEHPFAYIRDHATKDRRALGIVIIGLIVAGLNMTTFMWTKPLLNYFVPFRADPWLARLDYGLFLSHDPWTQFAWLNSGPMAIFYHRGWFALLIFALIVVLAAPPSPRKSAVMLTYFLLWSVVGPLIHTLIPAAGPIFYADLGYGDRFSGLHRASETREVADYLWSLYANGGFGAGAGISAMPSLHIATTTWILLAIHRFARRLFVPFVALGGLIFLLSIALGWHYASDGIVAVVVTIACYKACHAFYAARPGERKRQVLLAG